MASKINIDLDVFEQWFTVLKKIENAAKSCSTALGKAEGNLANKMVQGAFSSQVIKGQSHLLDDGFTKPPKEPKYDPNGAKDQTVFDVDQNDIYQIMDKGDGKGKEDTLLADRVVGLPRFKFVMADLSFIAGAAVFVIAKTQMTMEEADRRLAKAALAVDASSDDPKYSDAYNKDPEKAINEQMDSIKQERENLENMYTDDGKIRLPEKDENIEKIPETDESTAGTSYINYQGTRPTSMNVSLNEGNYRPTGGSNFQSSGNTYIDMSTNNAGTSTSSLHETSQNTNGGTTKPAGNLHPNVSLNDTTNVSGVSGTTRPSPENIAAVGGGIAVGGVLGAVSESTSTANTREVKEDQMKQKQEESMNKKDTSQYTREVKEQNHSQRESSSEKNEESLDQSKSTKEVNENVEVNNYQTIEDLYGSTPTFIRDRLPKREAPKDKVVEMLDTNKEQGATLYEKDVENGVEGTTRPTPTKYSYINKDNKGGRR